MADRPTPGEGAVSLPTECDLVMKGGITSGVVYPRAAVELAKKYRFRSIGGASAGAIAAALTAAAELGRTRGLPSFARLERESGELGGRLRSLFQPSPALRPLFEIVFAVFCGGGPVRVAGRLALTAVRRLPGTTLLGLLPALAIAWLAWRAENAAHLLAALLSLLLLLPALWLLRLLGDLFRTLPAAGFGLCPGIAQAGGGGPALLDWLADLLDDLAGIDSAPGAPRSRPLTFGDLTHNDGGAAIELRAMTSCLTSGRPYSLPFDNDLFYFRADELRRLLPARVVDWMVARAEPAPEPGVHRFPAAADLPVVAAVRMSLSFPFLFAAVPLWARDFTQRDGEARQLLRRHWFSDGGLCSNFPIHFFDKLWPSRPTFGITLESYRPGSHAERVFLPLLAGQGVLRNLREVETLGGFAASLLDTLQEWQDNLQSTLAGYRERIVHIALDPEEGGLNLDMDPARIARLAGYGREAGERLATRFDWEAHRWTRALSALEQLDEVLGELAAPHAGIGTVADLVARRDPATLPYAQSRRVLDQLARLVADLESIPGSRAARTVAATGHFPRPTPRLRLAPRI